MRVRVGLALALTAAACGKDPGAVEATVVVAPNAKAQCLEVIATTAAGPGESTGPIARGGQNQFVVAIYPNANLSGDITVQALGFIDAACATQIEQSTPVAAAFQSKTIDQITLHLGPAPCESGCTTPPGSCFQGSGGCGTDGGCSYTPLQTGTACALDGGTGCTDDACDGTGNCVATPKLGGTPCPDDNNPCTADLCDSSGHCTHPLLDAGTVCSGGNSCASAGTCTNSGQCVGIPVTCTTPPSQCFSDASTCTVGVG
ncbi:MAG TPA: hypothetical protein VH208_03775 [Myxococcaceae bacterium]|nr:hypothetical protein [Myxococcaceae bacterium]